MATARVTVIATTRIRRGVQLGELAFYEEAGREWLAGMVGRGELIGAWSRLDRREALFVLSAVTAVDAQRLMVELPVVSCELASLHLTSASPFCGWAALMRRPSAIAVAECQKMTPLPL